jgi:MSHA pilin protein MshA
MEQRKSLMRNQEGFTLIEIIAVLVLLGILAAVAVPKYFDMQEQAEARALEGVAGNIASAVSLKFAKSLLDSTVDPVEECTAADINTALEGGIPAGYTISGDAPDCTITQTSTSNTKTIVLPVKG